MTFYAFWGIWHLFSETVSKPDRNISGNGLSFWHFRINSVTRNIHFWHLEVWIHPISSDLRVQKDPYLVWWVQDEVWRGVRLGQYPGICQGGYHFWSILSRALPKGQIPGQIPDLILAKTTQILKTVERHSGAEILGRPSKSLIWGQNRVPAFSDLLK